MQKLSNKRQSFETFCKKLLFQRIRDEGTKYWDEKIGHRCNRRSNFLGYCGYCICYYVQKDWKEDQLVFASAVVCKPEGRLANKSKPVQDSIWSTLTA